MTTTRREQLLAYIEHANELAKDNNLYHTGPKPYAALELWLMDHNVEYYQHPNGLLLADKYIITASGRWRVKGRNTWYWYSTIDKLLDKVGINYDVHN